MLLVYPSNGEFVIADEGGWLPGSYTTADAAKHAGETFSAEQLQRLQDEKNEKAGGFGGVISRADLDTLKAPPSADAASRSA